MIRKSNPKRTIVVEPGRWATVPALDFLHLPADDANLIVSVHNYEPFPVTHQGAEWVGLLDLRGVVFPGPPAKPLAVPLSLRKRDDIVSWIDAYNRVPAGRNPSSALAIASQLADAAEWSARFGRPVHIGEFGAFQTLDPASRARYARAFRIAAERRKIPWCWWEWKGGFGYWDPAENKPMLRQALFAPTPGPPANMDTPGG